MGNSGWAVPRFHELSEAEATITAPCKQLSHPNGRTGQFKNAALHPMTIVWRYSCKNQEYRSTTAGEAPTSVLGSDWSTPAAAGCTSTMRPHPSSRYRSPRQTMVRPV